MKKSGKHPEDFQTKINLLHEIKEACETQRIVCYVLTSIFSSFSK